jgi:hypothetical protein
MAWYASAFVHRQITSRLAIVEALSRRRSFRKGGAMFTILLVVLVLMLLGAIPAWPHSRGWGYYPSGGVGLVLLVLVVLMLSGRL